MPRPLSTLMIPDIMEIIDYATEPDRMSKPAAVSFLEQIEDEIRARKEALHDEMLNEAEPG